MTSENLNYNETVKASILDAARALFAKFGYKKTTMEDIAHELHKGKSSVITSYSIHYTKLYDDRLIDRGIALWKCQRIAKI